MSNQYDPRITTYFGDAVMRAGFIPIPHLFMRHYRALGLTANQAMFLLQIMEGAWDLGAPPRTVGDLALRMAVDARTIRRYTEEIAKLGLINLYDQYDAWGAQIENGYDLSPLFTRLGELAPEPAPSGAIRRKARGSTLEEGAPRDAGLEDSTRRTFPPPPGQNDPPPPRTKRYAPPDKTIQPREDLSIRGPRIERSGLKGKPRIRKNQETQFMHDVIHGGNDRRTSGAIVSAELAASAQDAGFSLRQKRTLSASEVNATGEILRLMEIDQPVRGVVASSLAPAEAWALWCCAQARGWSTALTVAQVYDKRTKQARQADDVTPRYDAVGEMLARIGLPGAEALLRLISANCPNDRQAVFNVKAVANGGEAVVAAAEALWRLMFERRRRTGQEVGGSEAEPVVDLVATEQTEALDCTWQAAMAGLPIEISETDREVWLGQSRLVHLAHDLAVVGTPNLFVRDEVRSRFVPVLEASLQRSLGRHVAIDVVIGTS